MLSGMFWATPGINVLLRKQNAKIQTTIVAAKTIHKDEFVKPISYPPILMGIIFLISNCSIGLDTAILSLVFHLYLYFLCSDTHLAYQHILPLM